MPRFVILEHDHPHLHWDLMLEADGVLQTWRLAQPPENPGCVIGATALDDHRVWYLDYEGPVSGERGTVKRWDAGEVTEAPESTFAKRLLLLHGARIQGRVHLEQVDRTNWRFGWLAK
jgi:DNA polymerase Ligase (LigD)